MRPDIFRTTRPARPGFPPMNLHRWLAPVFVILMLAGCAQVTAGRGPTPVAPSSRDSGTDMGGDDKLAALVVTRGFPMVGYGSTV